MKIRTFIAVDVRPHVGNAVQQWQEHLKSEYPGEFRWVDPDKFHITLSFLGEVQKDRIDGIVNSLQETVKVFSPFEIPVEAAGAFPNPGHPRVLWVGVCAGNQRLRKLQDAVAGVLQREHGFEPERREFHPHVTIARGQRRGRLPDLSSAIREVEDISWGTQKVQQIEVFRSDLHSGGPVYTSLASPGFAEETD